MSYQADITAQKALLPFYRPFLEAVLDRMRVLMASSPQYIEHSQFLRRRREKCRVIPLGIDLEPFEQLERYADDAARLRQQLGGEPLILFVGRFRYVPARLVLVGGGGEERALRALHLELGLGDRVRFAGSLDQAGLLTHLRAADVFVLPSIFAAEAFGLAMIEAMAAGLPVVCTELGTGTSFVNLHEETGLVVPSGDARALAAALNLLIADPGLRRRMGDAGRRRAQAMFSTDSMVEHVLRIYEEVTSGSGR
jgi:rhamnosyl/mannosyltransferase